MTARLATWVLSAAMVAWGGRDIAKSGFQTKGKKKVQGSKVTVRMHVGLPLVAFSLAGHKNRLLIFPVPGQIIHKPSRADECCRADKMPFTLSEQESDQEERTRGWTKRCRCRCVGQGVQIRTRKV